MFHWGSELLFLYRHHYRNSVNPGKKATGPPPESGTEAPEPCRDFDVDMDVAYEPRNPIDFYEDVIRI